jgi:hypothetical protein
MSDTATPQYTATVNQSVFLEPLMGAAGPQSYLDRFPDEVYNKGIDTHLVKFMYALLGPAGIGWLRRNYLEARLLFEEFGVELFDLERFFGNPFQFGRVLEEVYDEDPRGLLPQAKWNELRAKDAAYRNRAIDFLNGVRMGNTPAGMKLIARAGLGHEVEIIENYKALFNDYTDKPLDLAHYGQTRSTEEMIVVPRREVPRSEVQTITIYGNPTGGTFKLKYDIRETVNIPFDAPARSENYRTLANTAGAPAIRVSSENTLITVAVVANAGSPATLNDLVIYDNAVEQSRYDHPKANLASLVAEVNAVDNDVMLTLITDGTALALLAASNLTAFTLGVQEALEALPNIGANNVEVTGGPGPSNPYQVYFVNELSNRDVLPLTSVNALTGGSSPAISTTTNLTGVATADETVRIDDRHRHNLQAAVDRIRPQTTIPTVNEGRGLRSPQIWAGITASSEYSTVLKYITGKPDVLWPDRDAVNWVEAGVEHEAPRLKDDLQHHYQNFHTVASIKSYNEGAEALTGYDEGTWDNDPYMSEHVGRFSPLQSALFPEFADFTDSSQRFLIHHALAEYENLPVARGLLEVPGQTETILQGSYPESYVSLQGVRPIVYQGDRFWSSDERATGDEYLEIDLGEVKAVNYISFETTRKPVAVELDYDRLDQTPARKWEPVVHTGSTRTFSFSPEYQSSWTPGLLYFTNARGGLVYTRHLRLKFSRQVTNDSPFKAADGTPQPSTVDVRNLRVGRNLTT